MRVNCVCPGWVATEKVVASLSGMSAEQRAANDIPEPMLTPEDIGEAVVDIAGNEKLFGRVILYYEPGKKRIVPVDLDLFSLSEEF